MSSSSKRTRGNNNAGPSTKRPKIDEDCDDGDYFEDSDDEDDAYENSEDEYRPTKSAGTSPRKKEQTEQKNVKAASKAQILSLATDTPPEARQNARDRLAAIDKAVISRIKKALALGSHATTGEAEAKAAMRLASKMMAQHNVEQADILATEDDAQKLKRAGQSTVKVISTSKASVILHSWSASAAQAVEIFFDCKCYSTSRSNRIDWTFYGLAEQTVASAYAYEMVYNLIMTWSMQNKAAKGRSGKNNYCHGVATGLYDLAKREQKEEERRAIKKEKARIESAAKAEEEEGKKALERLKGPVKAEDTKKVKLEEVSDEEDASAFPSSDPVRDNSEDSDGFDGARGWSPADPFKNFADFHEDDDVEDMLRDLDATGHINPIKPDPDIKPGPAPVKVEDEDDTPWASGQQLQLFRSNALSVADDYAKEKLKLKKGRQRQGPNLSKPGDWAVYKQGKEDAKKIDVKRKRIKDAEQD